MTKLANKVALVTAGLRGKTLVLVQPLCVDFSMMLGEGEVTWLEMI